MKSDYLPLEVSKICVFLYAHLHMIPNIPTKFHQYLLKGIEETVLTEYLNRQTKWKE